LNVDISVASRRLRTFAGDHISEWTIIATSLNATLSVFTLMSGLRFHFLSVISTAIGFIFCLWLNEHLFAHSEYVRGINWVYLPAGIRLLSTLLLGADGAIGLLVASWIVNFWILFPDDFVRAFVGGIIAAAAPYAVYRLARERYGLDASLVNLTPKRLLILAFAYSVASPLLHHIWFALRGDTGHLVKHFFVMFAGDLSGSLIVLYALKGLLALAPRAKATPGGQAD
jgi:hypothetical protein